MCRLDSAPVQAWQPAVAATIGNYNIPGSRRIDRVLRWISIESCGNECSIDGSKRWQDAAGWIQDAGVMQLYFENQNSVVAGATSASLRANCIGTSQGRWRDITDDERIAHISPQLAWLQGAIAHAQGQLDAVGANWPERDQWRWYKFSIHGLPAFAKCVLWMATQQLGRAPNNWDEMRSVFEALSIEQVQAAAADPADNGCTGALGAHGAWSIAWNNAEEMDLPDEASIFANLTGDITDSTSLSGTEIVLLALTAFGAVAAAIKFDRWLGGHHAA